MLLLLIPQGGGLPLDIQSALNDAVYRLGFASPQELSQSNSWVSGAELYQWADDAAKRLAYESGLFITYDASITVTNGTAAYNLPSTHVFTLQAWLGSQQLRLTAVRDLWALDATWSATSGPAKRCSLDAGAVGTITLYPNPSVGGTLAQICQEFPATIQPGNLALALPAVLQDYFTYFLLAGARGKESDHRMAEMAAHFKARCDLYEQVIDHLYGPGQ